MTVKEFLEEREMYNPDIEDVVLEYTKLKCQELLLLVADKWKDKIEPHVYQAMYNYKIETTTELNRISQYEI